MRERVDPNEPWVKDDKTKEIKNDFKPNEN